MSTSEQPQLMAGLYDRIESAAPFGWERYVGPEGTIIGVNSFGASAPGPVVMREFGFTPEHVVATAKALLTHATGDSHVDIQG